MKNISVICAFLLLFAACKKKTESPPDVGYAYAPSTPGKYVIYDVDSTVYDDFKHDTTYYKYRIKEKLEEYYTDNEGRDAIKLIRYIKKYDPAMSYDQMSWEVKDVWNYTKTATTLEVVEENQRFTKLIFPVREEATWNGNAFNIMGEWEYTYEYADKAEVINGVSFDEVLQVVQKDDKLQNMIHRQYYIEKYAKGVGLVYREIKDLYSSTPVLGVPVENRITKGVIYKLKYVTHGYE